MSTDAAPLSGVMKLCLQRAKRHGRLVKTRGGFWIGANEPHQSRAGGFMTSTVTALMQRGHLKFIDHKNGAPVTAAPVEETT